MGHTVLPSAPRMASIGTFLEHLLYDIEVGDDTLPELVCIDGLVSMNCDQKIRWTRVTCLCCGIRNPLEIIFNG